MIKRYKDFLYAIIGSAILIAGGFIAIFNINRASAVIFLIVSVTIFAVFFIITYQRIREIRIMSEYLRRINDGEFDLDITDNQEGELSVLKNNIYKVVVTLRSQQELLLKDKNYLADSLADISHQLKTPITSITVMTDLLKTETDEIKRREFLEVINSQLSRINWLIVTLLKLSRIDAGAVEFKKERTNLGEVIENAAKPFLINADVKGIELTTECSDDVFADVDRNWYTEAISNIIKNCIEHTGEGGFVSVSAFETPVLTKIIIQDNGSGISPEDLPHIFERFYQGRDHSETSVGIGLALSKAILNRQNSLVDVTSEIGKGTKFEITLYKTIV